MPLARRTLLAALRRVPPAHLPARVRRPAPPLPGNPSARERAAAAFLAISLTAARAGGR